MHFGSMLSVFPCIINAQPWRSALPSIGLTAWADVRGLANSLFTPLHCSERVRDFMNITKQEQRIYQSTQGESQNQSISAFRYSSQPNSYTSQPKMIHLSA